LKERKEYIYGLKKKLEELFKKLEKRKRVDASIKAKAVILYFNGVFFRKVARIIEQEMGLRISPEAVRLWWHSLAKFLRTIYTLAMLVYVVERWFKHIKQRMKGFYKRFPHNAKYETVWSWLASFILIKSLHSSPP